MSAAVLHPPSWRDATHRSTQTALSDEKDSTKVLGVHSSTSSGWVRVGTNRLTHSHTLADTQREAET